MLPHPVNDGETVSVAAFVAMTGTPKASVQHRYHRLLTAGLDPLEMPREAALAALTQRQDRRIQISLPLPTGRILRGGVRELAARVLMTASFNNMRYERVGLSTIRARLRSLPGWPHRIDPAGVAWAFGYGPVKVASPPPQRTLPSPAPAIHRQLPDPALLADGRPAADLAAAG